MPIVTAHMEPLTFVFTDDGLVPNNPMPFLIYKGAIAFCSKEPERVIETIFAGNGWGDMWRNGIYPFTHYHSMIH